MAAALPSRALPAGVSIAAMVALAASALLLFNAVGDRSPATLRTGSLATMSLTGDAGGSLFNSRALVPGHPVSNCIQIVNRGQAGGDVRLAATDLTGTLISGLRLRVELGTGGEIGDCTGFTGAAVYDGLLTGLTADSGVSTGWTPAAGQTKTYRLTVEVLDDDALQATTGGATLSWRLTPGPTATSTDRSITDSGESPSPSGSAPVGTAAPTSASPSPRTGTSSSAPASQGHPSATTIPSGASSSPAVPGAGGPPAGPDQATTGWRAFMDALGATQNAAWKLFVATARHPWYLLFSLAVMFLFLFFTDRVGLRDPKLALAPVTRDPYLRFPAEREDDSGHFN